MKEVLEGQIIDYPINSEGKLVTRRAQLTKLKPRLDAPPPGQPGSVDWTLTMMFRSSTHALQMIESLVAGQGENASEKWVQFVLLYKKWELEFTRGDLDSPPTFNQVCHSLNFPADEFLREFQVGLQQMMKGVAAFKASLAVPEIMNRVVDKATTEDPDIKYIELGLRIAGVTDEKGGVNVQINNTNQTAIAITKGEREKMKTPLLQFSSTLTEIDDEVRRDESTE